MRVKARTSRGTKQLTKSIVVVFGKDSKGAAIIAQKRVFAQWEIAELQTGNKAATRRKSHKRNQISALETLTVEAGLLLTDPKNFEARSDEKTAK
jgi:hypothetical protein